MIDNKFYDIRKIITVGGSVGVTLPAKALKKIGGHVGSYVYIYATQDLVAISVKKLDLKTEILIKKQK